MTLIACSGPGAFKSITDSIVYAQVSAMIIGGLFVLSIALWLISNRAWAMPLVKLFLLATHPAWTISAVHGDCGMLKESAATVYTVVASVVVAIQFAVCLWPRRLSEPAPN